MRNKKFMDFISKALLLLEGIILGIICMLMVFFFSEIGALVLIAVTLLVILSMYVVLKYRYQWMAKYNSDRVIDALRQMKDNTEDKINIEEGAFAEIYKELEEMRKLLIKNDKLRRSILGIADSVAVNMDLQTMLEDMLPKIIEITESNCGAFYFANTTTNRLEIKYSLGFNKNIYNEFDINLGEGLIGEIAKNREIKIIREIPEDTVYIARTFLGSIKPKNLMVVPVVNGETLSGALVLSSINEYTNEIEERAVLIRHYLGIAVNNGIAYETNKRLTNELKFQNKLIQDFNTELENKVIERSLLYDNVINSIKEYAIYSMDKNGVITTWNAGAEDLMGYKKSEVLGKHISTIYTLETNPVEFVESRLGEVIQKGRLQELMWRTKKDGSKYYADVTIFGIYDNTKNLVGFTNVTRDITGIVNLEQSLVSERTFSYKIISMYQKPVIVIDKDFNIKFINKFAERSEGISSDRYLETPFYNLFEENKRVQNTLEYVKESMTSSTVSGIMAEPNEKIYDVKLSYIQEELVGVSIIAVFNEPEAENNLKESE